ncbi:MAG: hypothetical protein IH941_04275 [Acidobacteria bacterium]|nr:hypothetical protein [Acidobacteriota bacterium]
MVETGGSFKKLTVGLALMLFIAACGDDSSGSTIFGTSTTAASSTTSTTAAPAPTASSTTTTVAATTTAAVPTTTTTTVAPTTTAPPPSLSFETGGLGIAQFGDDDDAVVATFTALFGPPLRDTGWIEEVLCPGPLNRFVDFGVVLFDFQLMFTTGDLFSPAGVEHLYSYRYNGATPVTINPPDLTVGTKVSELQALHPGVVFQENPFLPGVMDYFVAAPGSAQLYGQLTGVNPGDLVTSVQGGIGCGE